MKNLQIYLVLIAVVCLISSCRKKTSVTVKLFNPALNEYVANATVVLVEKKGESGGGIFGGNASCKEIAVMTTDANGECYFDKENLRTAGKYNYFCAVKQSWGLDQFYTCGGRTSGFIEKGGSQQIILTDEADGFLQVQFNNLLNPSQQGDSLIVSLVTIEYPNPKGGVVQGNGGVFGNYNFYGEHGFPFPAVIISNIIKTKGQRLKRRIRKIKMGVLTTSVDTIKVYPNQTKIVEINW